METLTANAGVKSVLLLNLTTHRVLFEKNADTRLPFASITKIVTSVLALEKTANPEQATLTMEPRSLEEVRHLEPALTFVYDLIGEEVPLLDLLHGCLMESGCEAAQQLAYYVGDGSMERFLALANGFVRRLGCENTHLIDPTGLFDEGHYATARDISRILTYAMENPLFRRIVSTSRYKMPYYFRPLYSTNALLLADTPSFFPYALGGKTGLTAKAGRCLACLFERCGQTYLWVSLGFPFQPTLENKWSFFKGFVAEMLCLAFAAEGDFMRVTLPEHYRPAQPGDRFRLSPAVIAQNTGEAPRFRFGSSDQRIATVSPEGWVTVHAQGLVQLEVTTQTGDYDLCYLDARPTEEDTLRRGRTPEVPDGER